MLPIHKKKKKNRNLHTMLINYNAQLRNHEQDNFNIHFKRHEKNKIKNNEFILS